MEIPEQQQSCLGVLGENNIAHNSKIIPFMMKRESSPPELTHLDVRIPLNEEQVRRDLAQLFREAQEALEAEQWRPLDFKVNQLRDRMAVSEADKLELLGNLLLRICERNPSANTSSHDQLETAQLLMTKIESCGGSLGSMVSGEQSATCLMLATKSDQPKLVEMLLEWAGSSRKQQVNACDRYGWTALFYAAYFGSFECGLKLVENGAQVNLVDCDGVSCLIWASGRGHYAMAKLLVQRRAKIGELDRYKSSAFIWACRKGESRIVELLLEHGAQVDEPGMYGWTPLIAAVRGGHIETVRLLLAHRPISLDATDGEQMSPLLLACREGQVEMGLELMRAGAQVNAQDIEGNTPLILATRARSLELMAALLERGAELTISGKADRDPLQWAIVGNHLEACHLLLEARRRLGLDIEHQTNRSGETYLMLAAKHRRSTIIKTLLDWHHSQPKTSGPDELQPVSCSRQQATPRLSLRPDDVY